MKRTIIVTVSHLFQHSSSFRDPSGYIYEDKNTIYRSIKEFGRKQYEAIRHNNAIAESINNGFLINTKELPFQEWPNEIKDSAYVLQHDRIPYVSYPYEWSFCQLKSAAIHHLDFQLYLFKKGIVLKDASAYNIQFIGTTPLFIDLLSLKPYQTGEYWTAHKQFCENFLNPLLLRSILGIPHNHWFRGTVEGIPTMDLANLIPLHKKLSWNMFSHILLQAKLDRSAIHHQEKTLSIIGKRRPLPAIAYESLLLQMRKWINKLHPHGTEKTTWSDYSSNHTYSSKEALLKKDFIAEFTRSTNPDILVDLGCNTGDYSFTALENGAKYVIGFDFDQNALDGAYQRGTQYHKPFLPLYLDATNPSPSQGWLESERQGFNTRTKTDAIIALAFIHHLAIAKNIPLHQLIDWLLAIAPTGVIEFIPKSDPTISKMLFFRDDIFIDYTESNFENLLQQKAILIKKSKISSTGRTLFWYQLKLHPGVNKT